MPEVSLELLQTIEWSCYSRDEGCCPICSESPYCGGKHKPDCELGNAIAKALAPNSEQEEG